MSIVATRSGTAAPTWTLCNACRRPVYVKTRVRNAGICPECSHHGRLDAGERIAQLLDPGSVRELAMPVPDSDPLTFVDSRPYPERLAAARTATGLDEAVVVARGTIEGTPLVLAVMDFRFMGGSLSAAVGELITRAAEEALAQRTPLLVVTASGGARMQEGAIALMQLVKTSQALARLDEAGILTVTLVTDPTYGGVAASFATLSDVVLVEPGARLGFAGPRVIEQTIRRPLPAGLQTAEFLLDAGLIDAIVPRDEQRAVLGALLRVAAGPREWVVPVASPARHRLPDHGEAATNPSTDSETAWRTVQKAREVSRPTTADYVRALVEDFVELRGDRVSGDCAAVLAGVGRFQGRPIVVIGHQKGHDAAELAAHNFGMARPAGYRKAIRLMKLASKLSLPVVTLVDTPGAYPGVEAEERGQAFAIAECIQRMAELPCPTVAVIIGEGGSGGALALAAAEHVLACANAIYSVISPEGCASILWNDTTRAPAAAAALRLHGEQLRRLGVVDALIPEPPGGTGADPIEAAEQVGAALRRSLSELVEKPATALRAERGRRFRGFGAAGSGGKDGSADVAS